MENLDDSPESVMLESVLVGMAEYYSQNLAREVMKGMKETALQCKHTGGKPPFGYDVDPTTKKYIINEFEAKGVQIIFDSVIDGKGYGQIIKELNRRGYKTKYNKQFGKNSIHEILRNEKYTGIYVFNKVASKKMDGTRNSHYFKGNEQIIRIPDGMPTIISEEKFQSVQMILASRKRCKENSSAKEVYLLSGKIFCSECGKAYSGARKFGGKNKIKQVTYRCINRDRGTSSACCNKEVNRDYLECFVLSELSKIIFDEKNIPRYMESYRNYCNKVSEKIEGSIGMKKKQIAKLQKQIDNIVNVIATAGSSSLLSRLETLEHEKFCLENEIKEELDSNQIIEVTEEEFRQEYKIACDLFEKGTLPEIRQLLNLYLQKVIIYKEHVEVYLNVLFIFSSANHYHMKKIVAIAGGGEAPDILDNYIAGINKENLENLPAIIEETGNPLEEVLYIGKKILKKFYVEGQISQE